MDYFNLDLDVLPNDLRTLFVVKIKFAVSKEEAEERNVLERLLRRLRQFLDKEFPDQMIFFQLNANFQLININSKELRQFSGNIFPNSHDTTTMKSRVFCRFQNHTSIRTLLATMTQDHACSILSRFNTDMDWAFHGVTTFVISLRMNLRPGHSFLHQFDDEEEEENTLRQIDVEMDTSRRHEAAADASAAAAAAVVVAAAAAAAASTADAASKAAAAASTAAAAGVGATAALEYQN